MAGEGHNGDCVLGCENAKVHRLAEMLATAFQADPNSNKVKILMAKLLDLKTTAQGLDFCEVTYFNLI